MTDSTKPLFLEVKREFGAFGTKIELLVLIANKDEAQKTESLLESVQAEYARLEKIFSRFDPESELSKFNSNLGISMEASEELREICKLALEYNFKTDGYFDPRILDFLIENGYSKDFSRIDLNSVASGKDEVDLCCPLAKDLEIDGENILFRARMDFAGLVKGWATDLIAEKISKQGFHNSMVNSGGDIFFAGHDEKGNAWPVDVEGISYEKLLLQLSGKGIATSGIGKRKWEKNGKRFHHLVNPKNKKEFSFDLNSVTVVADSTEQADVLAKTLFLMGKEEAKAYAQKEGLACVILNYTGEAWVSQAMNQFIYQKNI
ncbi:MAG TPA: FAD:protein FMN transferase [Patescibacteria group bacterium]